MYTLEKNNLANSSATNTALSALLLAQRRLNITAENISSISNVNTALDNASIIKNGIIATSETKNLNNKESNLENEMVDLIYQKNYFKANINVIKTENKMLGQIIDILV